MYLIDIVFAICPDVLAIKAQAIEQEQIFENEH